MIENNNNQPKRQQYPLVMSEIGLLNVCINDVMVQLNKTVRLLLEENQTVAVDFQQLETER